MLEADTSPSSADDPTAPENRSPALTESGSISSPSCRLADHQDNLLHNDAMSAPGAMVIQTCKVQRPYAHAQPPHRHRKPRRNLASLARCPFGRSAKTRSVPARSSAPEHQRRRKHGAASAAIRYIYGNPGKRVALLPHRLKPRARRPSRRHCPGWHGCRDRSFHAPRRRRTEAPPRAGSCRSRRGRPRGRNRRRRAGRW